MKSTLARLEWYFANGYKPYLPDGVTQHAPDRIIQNRIEMEYSERSYMSHARTLASDFQPIKREFSQKLHDLSPRDVPDVITVYLTNYGVGGSYRLPNTVIFNIHNKKGIKTILHEITHLIIEPWVQQYKVQHWEKELIVDLILNSQEFSFLGYRYWQKDYQGAENYIDRLFYENFFSNPESFFQHLHAMRKHGELL